MWSGDVTAARIIQEIKGKATERRCSLQCPIQTEKEMKQEMTS